ncbi:MAG: hypothetical protein ACYTGZ_11795, partial [Planctomycetota bacterium]
ARVNTLANNVFSGQAKLILNPGDFEEAFPLQRQTLTSPPGPPVLGTISTGVGPTSVNITGLPNSLGVYAPPFCFSPILFSTTIVSNANSGESTVDFTEVTNLSPNVATTPDLRGVNTSSAVTDMTWSPPSLGLRATYFYIAGIGGTVELFATGQVGGEPSVRPESSGASLRSVRSRAVTSLPTRSSTTSAASSSPRRSSGSPTVSPRPST